MQWSNAVVLTPTGLTVLDKIKIGDLIWSREGWTNVVNKWSGGINQVFRYRTATGFFEGTQDHQIVCNGFKVPIKTTHTIDFLRGKYVDQKEIFDPQSIMDGLLIGDGTYSDGRCCLCVGQNDGDCFKSEIKLLFNRASYTYGCVWQVRTMLGKSDLPIIPERKIPDNYKFNNRKQTPSFLRGLFSANGSIVEKTVSLTATSERVIDGVQLMLSSIGIQSNRYPVGARIFHVGNKTGFGKPSFYLAIKYDVRRFIQTIGFLQQYKIDRMEILEQREVRAIVNKPSYNIIETKSLGEHEVFGITVDNILRTYWSGGCNISDCK